MRRIRKVPIERVLHLAVVDALWKQAMPGMVWFHPANERKCTPAQGYFLKRMGLKAGVPDFIILLPNGSVGFLELKRPGKAPTEPQREFLASAAALGHLTAVVRTIDEAERLLIEWGAIKPNLNLLVA